MSMKRLSIPLNNDQHQAIKLAAMLKGQSMKDYILGKVFSGKNRPNKETLQAMRDVEENKNLTTYESPDEFLKTLRGLNEQKH